MLNQFTGCSMETLRKRLAHQKKALADFYSDEEGGGGSPTEGMRERIADLEDEIARRELKALATGPVD